MNKLVLLGIIIFSAIAFVSYKALAKDKQEKTNMENKKVLIAYFSHTGHTKEVAEHIHKKIGGDLFEIKTEGTYPDDYKPMTEQVKKEIEAGYRPKLLNKIENINQYDVVFIGSPNWWGTITPQVSSFIESYNLNGKIIIPFITHGGGGTQNTVKNLTEQCKGCDVTDNPWVGYGSRTFGVSGWLEDLGFKK